jgi:hypothetical protein
MGNDKDNVFGEVIYSYTRAQAIADGVLVDVTETAKEAGFTCPVAMTREAWEECVAWSPEDSRRRGIPQDEKGRLWDVLWVLLVTIKRARGNDNILPFQIGVVEREGNKRGPLMKALKSHAGPGDAGELVITIMLPHES